MNPYGWDAAVIDDFVSMSYRVVFYRRTGDEIEVITGWDEHGWATVERRSPAVSTDDLGIRVPREAVAALAERIKPGPSQGEVARLEEALKVERQRVDSLLARIAGLTK